MSDQPAPSGHRSLDARCRLSSRKCTEKDARRCLVIAIIVNAPQSERLTEQEFESTSLTRCLDRVYIGHHCSRMPTSRFFDRRVQ